MGDPNFRQAARRAQLGDEYRHTELDDHYAVTDLSQSDVDAMVTAEVWCVVGCQAREA